MAGVDPPSRTEMELLTAWQAGDRRAGQLLVARYYPQVRRFFINAVEDRHRADLVQETFQRLVKSVQRFEGRSSFRTYLYRIARNTLNEHLKRSYRGTGAFDPLEHSVVDIHGISPSGAVMDLQRHQRLLECIRSLPVETKQLLELYCWQDLTASELAEVFDVPETTIRNRLAAARKRLHDAMQATDGVRHSDAQLDRLLQEIGEFFEAGPARS
jgi:RNA polymerase sigma-70 factor (ECF subfamily)